MGQRLSAFMLCGLALVLVAIPSGTRAEGVGQVLVSKSIPAATVALIDPESGSSAGGGTTDVKVAVGDIILFQFNFSGVPDLRSSGLQGYLTEFIPNNTQVVGVRLIDKNGLTITPRLPGVAEDSCMENCPASLFDNLPCSAGSGCGVPVANEVDLQNGTIAQVHADTGIFWTDDTRMSRDPADTFSTLANGINMSALGTEPIDATDIDGLIGVAQNADFFGHAFWDYVQMKAYGWKNSALSGNGGNGPTPFKYGSPVAGPETYYQYEATNTNLNEATVTVLFNDVSGPWGRIQYPGSLIGTGSPSTVASTNLPTRMGVETTAGWDLTPNNSLPDNSVALRYALGEVRVGEVRAAEVALRVLGTPLDLNYAGTGRHCDNNPMMACLDDIDCGGGTCVANGGDIDCGDVFGSDVSAESSGARADTNPWSAYLPSPNCVFLNLLFDLNVSKPVADGNDILTYTLRVKNLSTDPAGQNNVQIVASYTGSDFNFVSADGGGSEALCPGGSGVCPPGIGGGGNTCICWPIANYAPSDENTFTFQLDVGGTGSGANVVFANYISDNLAAPGFTTQALTIVKPVAVLEARLDPAVPSTTANSDVTFNGSFQNLGNQLATLQEITFILPSGWSLNSTPVLSEGSLSMCSGTNVVTCTVGGSIVDPEPACNDGVDSGPAAEAPDDDLIDTLDPECASALDNDEGPANSPVPPPDVTFTMSVHVPTGTLDGLYNIEIQTYHTQMGIGGDTESYFDVNTARAVPLCSDGLDNDGDMLFDYPDDPECDSALDDDETATLKYVNQYGTIAVGTPRSARPIVDCPIGDTATEITGQVDPSTTLDATIRLYFNGILRATGTATMLNWIVTDFATTPACSDGIDNDMLGDGIDWPADPECDSPFDDDEGPATTVNPDFGELYGGLEIRATAQGTGELESELSEPCFVSVVPACQDGIDNDMDGLTDFPADPGCSSASDGSEEDPVFECNDMIDNDGMNGTDFPIDPSCQGPDDDSEDGVTACDDGLDNDGDGFYDWDGAGMGAPDPGCCPDGICDPLRYTEVNLGVCQDGVDNDMDGLIDYPEDPGCHSANDDDEVDITFAEIKSRLFMIMDTSGSMNWNTCVPEFTGGDGSLDCPGFDVDCADLPMSCGGGSALTCNNMMEDDSRLYKIKEGVSDVVAGFGDVEYSLMRFKQKALDFGCPTSNASASSGGWQGAGAEPCGGGFNAGELLVNFGPENQYDLLEYMDHSTNWPGPGDPPPTLDFELRGSGTTPLDGALTSALTELTDLKTDDASRDCRPYIVILLTDGQETCGGDPVMAAGDLLAAPLPGPDVETYVIGFATDDPDVVMELNDIAHAGSLSGTRDAIFVDDSAALSTAMSQIVADSVLFEVCDGDDDDCDIAVDEGFTLYCDIHGARASDEDNSGTVNHPAWPLPVFTQVLCADPGETVCDGMDDNCNGAIDEGFTLYCDRQNVLGGGVVTDPVLCTDPGETVCDGIDDNCNGVIDENNVCDGCNPQPEICDGINNDCDMAIDEDTGGQTCGLNLGECSPGVTVCVMGVLQCQGAVGPQPEMCDGLDNNCDGIIDGITRPCGTDEGICQAGTQVCTNAVWGACIGEIGPLPNELCNGLDDDCDMSTDEGNPGETDMMGNPIPCGSDIGECEFGVLDCQGGQLVCFGGTGPTAETCNERDDDCDGVINDGVPTNGPCGSNVGDCSQGVLTCKATPGCEMTTCYQCIGETTGGPESCDGRDNDCDGMIDDGIPDRACGISTGECTVGTEMCDNGSWVNCTGQGPVAESCDGLDNDCDGVSDEGIASPGECMSGTNEGKCDKGDLICMGGSFTCVGAIGPSGESCNDVDDDCDMMTDENLTQPCGTDVGECTTGDQTCSAGVWGACSGQGPVDELCDLLDNDCDGLVDEEVPNAGPCGVDVGDCTTGVLTCISTPGCTDDDSCFQCVGAQVGGPEECDGRDNDCDTTVDEGLTQSCGTDVGECMSGTEMCVEGGPEPGEWVGCDAIQPIPEICDGLDNDCDGLSDEGIPTQGPCGLDVGDCSPGVLTCIGTPGCLGMGTCLQCLGASNGGPEICDDADNDCDMMTDEGLTQDCGSDQGECMSGTEMCVAGEWMNCTAVGPEAEMCDTLDNDCDGLVDEGNPEGGNPCGASDVGVCEKGIEKCISGMLTCIGEKTGGPEICDGLDNDCDGMVDEGDPEGGANCGDDTGECMSGTTACVGGELICQGGIEPTAEVCNSKDDDCDGVVDDGIPVGAPCGTDQGQCAPGLFVCTGGELKCDGEIGPVPEICDSLDNDCDGDVDEMLAQGPSCGTDEGQCEKGNFQCVDGKNVCIGEIPPGPEICDCEDNDCDGNVDEDPDSGSLCPGASECLDCQCATECRDDEFGKCPSGQFPLESDDACFCVEEQCTDMSCLDETVRVDGEKVCAPDEDGLPVCVCSNNECTFPCKFVSCKAGTTCHPMMGNCVEDNCRGLGCGDGQYCDVESLECQDDPCASVDCGSEEVCRNGECTLSCAKVVCDATEHCVEGSCVLDNCAGVKCGPGLVCDPADGACVENKCVNVACIVGAVCEPVTGECMVDPCVTVRCPEGQTCSDGDCFLPTGTQLDGGITINDAGTPTVDKPDVPRSEQPDLEDRVVAAGGGGCGSCAVGGGADSDPRGLWLALLVLGVLVARRRRNGVRLPWAAVALAAAAFWLSGCSVKPFCISCADTDAEVPGFLGGQAGDGPFTGDGGEDRDGGPDGGSRDSGKPDAGMDPCARPEECNGEDEDCDGKIDEDFNLNRDPEHCGGCGQVCAPKNAFGACNKGECELAECAVGHHDVNQKFSDGCEYSCVKVDEDVEVDDTCDGRDDDCDDKIDEDVDFDTDIMNCGKCGVVCAFNHATSTCDKGLCNFTDCADGFYDADGVKATGCEYECTPADPTTEVCNVQDDDCDGKVDEGDPGGGVACGIDTGVCEFGTTQCIAGAVQCIGGTEPDTEQCNDMDDDCDGNTDEGNGGFGAQGGKLCGPTVGACAQGRETCQGGNLVCLGITGPQLESCDGLDNDCDGSTDEGNPGGGSDCGNDTGECEFGSEMCIAGVFQCIGGTNGSPEKCDGLDNDCDGMTDEGDPFGAEGGKLCGESEGQCQKGREECEGAALVCKNDVGPVTETCNGLDDDCDGVIDNDSDPDPAVPCGNTTGECGATQGFEMCIGGIFVCVGDTKPIDEMCNGLDDDCDGTTDENNQGNTVPGAGGGRLCGSGEGLCVKGQEQCIGGMIQCIGAQGPFTEECDGLDNDCDTIVDEESDPEPPESCGDDTGECTLGTKICSGGIIVCQPGVTPVTEICDTLDNDCDGMTDEGNTPAGAEGGKLCGSSEGTCSPGVQTCVGAPGCMVGVDCIECVGAQGPVPEECDGLDNDCDGTVDEDDMGNLVPGADGGGTCGDDTGECAFGTQHCVGGTLSCVGATPPTAELCDTLDNDCDGVVDNGNPESGDSCGTDEGQCVPGVLNCVGAPGCTPGFDCLECQGAQGPFTETCNGLDDDCDGVVDEDDLHNLVPGAEGGAACGNNGGTGACVQGTEQCQGGSLVCSGGTGPTLETCDDIAFSGQDQYDNDCDGSIDEGFMLMIDVNNCGFCGNVCMLDFATPQCLGGDCEILVCDQNYHDNNDDPNDGCEYFCVGNEFVPEICDGVDNDCDGEWMIDEAAITPPMNFCNPNGVCGDDPDTVPVDPTQATCGGAAGWQCLYPPTYEPDFEMSCDGLDNDCDGAVDEDFAQLGEVCDNDGVGGCLDKGVYVCNVLGNGVECNAADILDPTVDISDEECNNIDDDCDGMVDERVPDDIGTPWRDGIDLSALDTLTVKRQDGSDMQIMRYEASRADALGGDGRVLSDCDPDAGPFDQDNCYACSQDGVLPLTNVTFRQAQAACWGLNPVGSPQPAYGDDTPGLWRLCEAEDWARACRSTTNMCKWSYSTDCSISSRQTCNGEEYDCDPGTPFDQDCLLETGSFPMCGADWGMTEGLLYDMSGNAKEWTSTPQGTGIYEIRGGAYNNIEAGRTCNFDFVVADEDFAHPNTGFRCCYY